MLTNECLVQGLSKVSSFETHQSLTGIDEMGYKEVLQTFSSFP